MAPGVCVTSFRMLFRRTNPSIISRHVIRLTPVTTFTLVNSRNFSYNSSTSGPTIENSEPAETVANTTSTKITQSDLTQWKVADLKTQLKSLGLSTTGKKQILIERLRTYYLQQNEQQQKQSAQSKQQQQQKEREQTVAVAVAEDVLLVNDVDVKTPDSMQSLKANSNNNTEKKKIVNCIKDKTSVSVLTSSLSPSSILLPQTPPATPPMNKQPIAEQQSLADNVTQPPSTTGTAYNLSNREQESCINDSNINHSQLSTVELHDDVIVEYIQGIPHLTIPLPSRNEKCEFTLKPISHKVGDLIEMLKTEDRGIDRATLLNKNGVRIASTCNIESLLDDTFWILINDKKYKVDPPVKEKIDFENVKHMGDVRQIVAQLYEALHVGEYHIQKSAEMETKLEDLKYQLEPLEQTKAELSSQAARRTNMMTWFGLGLMSVQFGILARLTWWEYSWDIMEPVTYFVTYGTTMAMYAYYCITKQEYNLPYVKDRQYLITLYKDAKKKRFDLEEYNNLKRQIAEIEFDLRRLRDPLNMQLPSHVTRTQEQPPAIPPPEDPPTKLCKDSSSKSSGYIAGLKIPFLDSNKKDS